MTGSDWTEADERPAKRGVPSWVFWGCGGGCLLFVLLAGGLLVLGGRVLHEAFDPEQAWSRVAELLPHDERPAGWKAYGTARFGVGIFFLRPPGTESLLVVQRARDGEEVADLMAPDSSANGGWRWFLEGVEDYESGTIELQGRQARCLRFTGTFSGFEERNVQVSGLRVDLTGAGVPTLLHVVLGPEAGPAGDERVRELLASFDLWRGR